MRDRGRPRAFYFKGGFIDDDFEITEDERIEVVNMAGKIGNLGGFIEAANSDSSPNSEGINTEKRGRDPSTRSP
jgi:hypothetical protein